MSCFCAAAHDNRRIGLKKSIILYFLDSGRRNREKNNFDLHVSGFWSDIEHAPPPSEMLNVPGSDMALLQCGWLLAAPIRLILDSLGVGDCSTDAGGGLAGGSLPRGARVAVSTAKVKCIALYSR